MSNNPLISVIVPVFNLESCIENTLRSIMAQTYRNLEIIVVDDGSADHSAEIVRRLQSTDSRIHLIQQKNSGVVLARRTGVDHAKGEYIGFVDGDDVIDDDMYAFLLHNILKENADISHCGYVMHVGERKDFYYNTKKYLLQDNTAGLYDLISGTFVEPGLWNKLYKREIIVPALHEQRIQNFKNLEDLLINYYAFKLSKKSVYEDQCKYHYLVRKNSSATSKINAKKIFDPIRVIRMIYDDCVISQVKNAAYKRYIAMLIGASTVRYSKEVHKDIIHLLKKEAQAVLTSSSLGIKIKTMFFVSTYLQGLYFLIRKIYAQITHVDKKYEV